MENKLAIGYFADGKWAHETFRLLANDKSLEVKFICARHSFPDEVLKIIAEENHIDYFTHKNINSEEFLQKISKYNCDLFVSMSFDQIFKKEIINIPRHKIINCHAGKLPFYRGRNVLNWVLINDEHEFGITVHYVDEGIDTGDIILQETHSITDEDNYSTLLDRAYLGCATILYKAIKIIQQGAVKTIKQSELHPIGFYCGKRGDGDEIINWNQTSRDIFNFIRAICKPGPMARSMLKGKEIKINQSNLIPNAPIYKGIPGQVVGKTEEGFLVKTKDSTLEIKSFIYDGIIRMGDRLE